MISVGNQEMMVHTASPRRTWPHAAPKADPVMVRVSPPRGEEVVGDTADTAGVRAAS